jgi:NAD-dependent histone deacetylase SIR2
VVDHCRLIASLAKKATLAEPTDFHNLLRLLDQHVKLRRIYTQNIDGLESKVGFDLTQAPSLSSICIQLHGSLLWLRCIACCTRKLLENHIHDLESGQLPTCETCEATQKQRVDGGKRSRQCGVLRPDVVLYDEVAEDNLIMEMASMDAKNVSKGDVLLVVGTSLKIPGIIEIIKLIGSAVADSNGSVIYLDLNRPPTSLEKYFTLFVEGDCEKFAKDAIHALTPVEERGEKVDGMPYMESSALRQDLRPLWDWI